ncbi:HAMP domain-containing sensor histidine kinase [Chromobacterium vaccinii]|uniref:sensor histidine kinase n=1 Tax=Chromobacterium vaccinii TaxID=1108595 RepID=UPI0031CEA500
MASKIYNGILMVRVNIKQNWKSWVAFIVLAIVLPMVCFYYAKNLLFSKQALEQSAGPGEGYYWAASQYRYAVQRIYGEANAYSLGVESSEDLSIAYDVLQSKYLVLNNSVSPQLKKNQSYAKLLLNVTQFMEKVEVLFPRAAHDKKAMRSLQNALVDIGPVIADLVMAAHQEEVRLRDLSIEQTLKLRNVTFLSFIFLWIVLVFFLARERLRATRGQEIIELQQRAIEAAQLAREEAVQTALARSTMLSTVSHEILTPLHTVQGGIELLTDLVKEPKALRTMANVKTAADYLSKLMQDLLDMGRLDAGRMILRPSSFEIDTLVASVVSEFQQAAKVKGLVLEFSVTDAVDKKIYADMTRMRQIIGNLISNAVRYTDAGKIIVHLDQEHNNLQPCLILSVADTGIGVPEEEKLILFDAFVQAKGASRGGAGMGLAIVKRIVALMNGEVVLSESEVGVGSVFIVRLPLTM